MTNIAIFASGSGTNAQKIIDNFSTEKEKNVSLILSNRADAYVLERARKAFIKSVVFDRHDFYSSSVVLERLLSEGIDFIVLAGFLWLIPPDIIEIFKGRIVNIHPALLPLYGGKGMYGDRVHRAVLKSGDRESGITIHHVNGAYDEGDIIFQAKCKVEEDDTIESLAQKVHELEYKYYSGVIARLIEELDRE